MQLNLGLMTGRRPVSGPKAQKPAGEAKPDVCALSDGEAGAYCTVGLVFMRHALDNLNQNQNKLWMV